MAGFLAALGGVLPLVGDLLKPAVNQLSRKIYGNRAVTGYSRSEMRRLVAGPGSGVAGGAGAYGFGEQLRQWAETAPPGSFPLGQEIYSEGYAFPKSRAAAGMNGGMMGPPSPQMSGFHWSRRLGRWVRNRRMNPCNPRALRRAMRRTASFAKFAKSAITFTQRVKMKKRKRR